MEKQNNDEQNNYVDFSCSNCNKLLRVKKESAGGKGQCPKCGYIIKVPSQKTENQIFL